MTLSSCVGDSETAFATDEKRNISQFVESEKLFLLFVRRNSFFFPNPLNPHSKHVTSKTAPINISILLMISGLARRWKSSASSSRWINRQETDFYTRQAKVNNYKSRAAFKLLQIDDKYHLFNPNKHTNVLDLGAAPGAWNQVALDRCHTGSTIVGVDILPYDPPMGVTSIQGNILSKMTHNLIRETFLYAELDRRRDELSGGPQVELKDPTTGDIELINDLSVMDQSHKVDSEEVRQIDDVLNNLSISKKVLPDEYSLKPETKLDLNDVKLKYPIDVIVSDMYVPFIQSTGFHSATTNNPHHRMANTTGLAIRDHAMSIDLCDAALITAIDLLKMDGSLVMKFFSGTHDKVLEGRLKRAFKKVVRFKPSACRSESKELYFICKNKLNYHLDKVHVFSAPPVK